jgi:hypothetical protein
MPNVDDIDIKSYDQLPIHRGRSEPI